LNENLLGGQTLRVDRWGENDGVQLVDLNGDGFMDVVHRPFKEELPTNRIWSAKTRKFEFTAFPAPWTYSSLAAMSEVDVEFGVVTSDGITSFLVKAAPTMPILGKPKDVYSGVWHFDDGSWTRDEAMTGSIKTLDVPLTSSRHGPGLRLLDVDGDGRCEIVTDTAIVHWRDGPWRPAGFALPDGISLRTTRSKETDVGSIESLAPSGLRFVDINIDGGLDVIFSNPDRYGIWLFKDMQTGWGIEVMSGKRGERPPDQELPPIVRADGSDNGFFVHSGQLFWQNEDTDTLPDLVDRRAFGELLKNTPQSSNR
jgi:hypothetical protein